MKGLLIKDLYTVITRKQTYLVFLLVCIFLGYTTDGSFIVGYMVFLSAIISVSTISYDEHENGMMYLMTLPCDRKTYALSQYVFGIIFAAVCWVIGTALMIVIGLVKGTGVPVTDSLSEAVVFLPLALIVLSLMIPVQLKYGAEKSRIVILVIGGAVAAVGALAVKLEGAEKVLAVLESIPDSTFTISVLLFTAVLTAVSVAVSIKVMKNKTF